MLVARKTTSGTQRLRRHSSGAGWPRRRHQSAVQSRCPKCPSPPQPRPSRQPPSAHSAHSAQRRLPTRMSSATAQDVSFPGRMQPVAVWQAGKFQLAQAEPRALIPTTLKPSRLACASINKPCILESYPQRTLQRPMKPHNHRCNPFPGGHIKTIPKPAMMVASTAASILDRSRCPAFPRPTQHAAVHVKALQRGAPPVTVYVVRPAAYVQARAAPCQAQPMIMSRETSFMGAYSPMMYPSVYVRNPVILPPRVLVRA